jgi:hypothetical protein
MLPAGCPRMRQDLHVPPTGSADDFDKWFALVTAPGSPDDPGEVSPAGRRWLRELYDSRGPISREAASSAYLSAQLALANDAVAAVLADLERTSPHRLDVVVDAWEGHSVRIAIDGGFTIPSMSEFERAAAFAEVGGYIQEQCSQEIRTWPVCDVHDAGLHPEARHGDAVWRCRLGAHDVALIGRLGVEEE